MSTERINISNPSATYMSNGYLDDYKLSFYLPDGKAGGWGGAAATLDNIEGAKAWGTIWRIGKENLESLDKQEGVPFIYKRYEMEIATENGERVNSVIYLMSEGIKVKGLPSPKYIETIRKGAKEHNLPKEYQEWLGSLEDNGYEGEVKIP